MLIVCPSCASRYELDSAKLGADGRKVRCASCQTLWHVVPEADMPAAPSAEETQALLNEELQQAAIAAQIAAFEAESAAAEAVSQPPAARTSAGKGTGKGSGRKTGKGAGRKPKTLGAAHLRAVVIPTALALVGLVMLGALVWQRDRVVRVAPQLAAAFDMLGLPTNVRGLKLGAVESGLVDEPGGRFLVIEGDVTNVARKTTRVPAIEVSVKDAAGQTLYSWKTEPPRPALEPSELMRFRARLAAPPAAGQSVIVRFAG